METNRQKKIATLLQQELANILLKSVRSAGVNNLVISVTKVTVTIDLAFAKAYISVFPSEKGPEIIEGINSNAPLIKHELAQITRHQLRKMPDLSFYLDDSLDYLEQIEKSLTGKEDPVQNPELLPRRKKY